MPYIISLESYIIYSSIFSSVIIFLKLLYVILLTRHQQHQIRYGQVEQIIIGGRVHRLVARYHRARDHIAQQPSDEDQQIAYRHGHHHQQRIVRMRRRSRRRRRCCCIGRDATSGGIADDQIDAGHIDVVRQQLFSQLFAEIAHGRVGILQQANVADQHAERHIGEHVG